MVRGKRVRAKRPSGHPRAGSQPPKTVVVHETLANLSRLPPELIELVESFCRGEKPANHPASAGEGETHVGPCYGVLAGLHALGRELGIVKAVGKGPGVRVVAPGKELPEVPDRSVGGAAEDTGTDVVSGKSQPAAADQPAPRSPSAMTYGGGQHRATPFPNGGRSVRQGQPGKAQAAG